MLISILAIVCVVLMCAAMLLHIFGLPANWVALILVALWFFLVPGNAITWQIFAVTFGLVLAGEALEAYMGFLWGKKYGASGKAGIAGMVGAIAGAIVGAPFFFGIGAFPGALAGAFAASLIVELVRGVPGREAATAAWGIMLGRFGGTVLKAAVGCVMIAITAPLIIS